MSLKDLIADVNVNEICEHIETETLSEWVNAWQETAISALRPVSREQVEKAWRGEWIGMTDNDGCTWQECSRCEHDLDSMEEAQNFCPACGAPMTDEAVDMVLKRLEVPKDDQT